MAVPKKHKTRSGRNQRRSHDFLFRKNLSVCSNCKFPVLPHEVCANCGFYKGRQVMKVKVQKSKVKS